MLASTLYKPAFFEPLSVIIDHDFLHSYKLGCSTNELLNLPPTSPQTRLVPRLPNLFYKKKKKKKGKANLTWQLWHNIKAKQSITVNLPPTSLHEIQLFEAPTLHLLDVIGIILTELEYLKI